MVLLNMTDIAVNFRPFWAQTTECYSDFSFVVVVVVGSNKQEHSGNHVCVGSDVGDDNKKDPPNYVGVE